MRQIVCVLSLFWMSGLFAQNSEAQGPIFSEEELSWLKKRDFPVDDYQWEQREMNQAL
jgi:hypothetical protein